MKEHHPSRELLELFALGDLPASEAAEVEKHLEVCSDCRDRADEAATLLSLPLLDWLGSQYDDAFDRAVRGAAEQLAGLKSESRNAEVLLAELLREPVPERRRKIREDERFHSLKLCQLLRTRSHDHRFSDPFAAFDLAELAAGVAQHLDPGRYGSDLVEDARALSWGNLSNSFRITSEPWRAERALRQAWEYQMQGSGDLAVEGELIRFTSSLRLAQNRYGEAAKWTDRAIDLFRRIGDREAQSAALIHKGMVLGETDRCQEAIQSVQAGLDCLEAPDQPLLAILGKHNLADLFARAGELNRAMQLLEEVRPRFLEIVEGLSLARLPWLEGRFDRQLGRLPEAEACLSEVLEVVLGYGIGTDVFLVSLELAELYAAAGQRRRVKEVLGEVISLGEVAGLSREVLAARLLYAQASRS